MKIAVISDIHGNLPALKAVLKHAAGMGAAQTILNLGDSTGYGPNPDEVLQRLKGESFINLRGDYDQKVLSKTQRKKLWADVKAADKRQMFAWTYKALSKDSRKFLKSLPQESLLDMAGFTIFMTHDNPLSSEDYLSPETSDEYFYAMAETYDADILLFGHSHQAFMREIKDIFVLNPGTVGRPDDGDPRASYAVLTIENRSLTAELYRVPYDISQTMQSMRQTGLSEIFCHVLRQGLNYKDTINKLGEDPDRPGLEAVPLVTLLTDFGLQDHFVGVLKGVIKSIAPQSEVIDISHQIQPQNIEQAARLLQLTASHFPYGTVHVAVVDPGFGTSRRAIAAQIGDYFYVAPDNGLLFPLICTARESGKTVEIISLDKPEYWLPEPNKLFHGKDILSPVGAHLANGLPLEKLGERIHDPVELTLSAPKQTEYGWLAEVVLIDVYGNLATNLPSSALPEEDQTIITKIKGETINGLTRAYADGDPGSLIATIDSNKSLSISEVNGSAKSRLDAKIGTPVEIIVGL